MKISHASINGGALRDLVLLVRPELLHLTDFNSIDLNDLSIDSRVSSI